MQMEKKAVLRQHLAKEVILSELPSDHLETNSETHTQVWSASAVGVLWWKVEAPSDAEVCVVMAATSSSGHPQEWPRIK